MKTKLLYVHNGIFPANSANRTQVINMCEGFSDHIDTTLLTFGKNKKEIKEFYDLTNEFNITLIKNKNNYHIRSIILFLKYLNMREKFNIVFTRDLLFAYLVNLIPDNKKIIYEIHDIPSSHIWKFLFKKTSKKINKIVIISEGLEKELKKFRISSKKTVVLHDGVDLKKFGKEISKLEARKKTNLPLNKKIILYNGTFNEWKGYKLLLETSKKENNILFVLVGARNKEKKNLEKKYKKAKIIKFVKNKEVINYLKASDILVIPNLPNSEISIKYTSPLKLFEYMASKRPILASNIPSIKKIVTKNEINFFKADNPEDLAKNIDKILMNNINSKIIENKVSCAFEHVKKFDWNKRAKVIKELN